MAQIVAFSGGKDSTAMALRMAEIGEAAVLLFTPTGDELPDCVEHLHRMAALTGWPLEIRAAKLDLAGLIADFDALPNNRQRWCTRVLKIEVAKAFLLEHPGSTLCVGLRADEEERQGMWGDYATYRYPLREWGWKVEQVYGYLSQKGIAVPERTDCALCYDQRLSEWWKLWKNHPARYARGEELEAMTGHTFRSPSRDTWPASLKSLRERFEAGDAPRGIIALPLFGEHDEPLQTRCRVCSL